MKDPRPWIALLAAVAFLAGVAAGVLIVRITSIEYDRGPFADYKALLVAEFDLSDERADHLGVILREYDAEIRKTVRHHEAAFYESLKAELLPKGIEYNRYIRDMVLRGAQRERFDTLVAGTALSSERR